jgi:general secretion pathway protein F
MQEAGLTLIESLGALINQIQNVRFKKIITDVREQVSHGSTLADSLAAHPSQFDDMYVHLVSAGEASGSLGQTLDKLANFNENRLRQRSRLAASMVYPLIMTVVGSGILLFLLGYVVPKTQAMFEDMSQALPLATVILLAVSNFLSNWWMAIIALVIVGLIFLKYYSGKEHGKRKLHRMALGVPVFGPIIMNSNVARFAGALGILMAGGVELIEALTITEKTMDNSVMADAVASAAISVTEGEPIAAPLESSGLFPPTVIQMIATGERSGSLVNMLVKIAEAYEFEVETSLSALTAMVEPILILVMGSVVGFIVMAILLPIFELSQIVG